jgi:hypothetical protein
MSQIPLPVGVRLPSEPPSRYQYQLLPTSGIPFEGFGTFFQPVTVARLNT